MRKWLHRDRNELPLDDVSLPRYQLGTFRLIRRLLTFTKVHGPLISCSYDYPVRILNPLPDLTIQRR